MSQHTSIYHSFAQLLLEHGQQVSPAELHGLMLGRCCAGASFSAESCIKDAEILFDGEVPASLHQALTGLQDMLKTELTTFENLAVTLLLPNDDCPLEQRISAMAQWCQGFLSGFGTHIGQTKLSAEVKEVLEDFVSISQIEEQAEEENDEASYMEISEYLRMTPVFLYTEHGIQPEPPAKEADKPAVH